MPTQVNCRVRRSDYIEISSSNVSYKGVIHNASIQIVDTRSGETMGVVIRKEDAEKIIEELTQIFNIK